MKSESAKEGVPVTLEHVAAFRLSRHHLAKRAPADALAQVAGDMAGAQAQVLSAAQISLWARTRGLRLEDIERALMEDRTLVKAWCMRGSLHLIPSRDFPVFVRGCGLAPRSAAWLARVGMRIDSIDSIIEAISRALDRPHTRNEIAESVRRSLGIKTTSTGHRGWGAAADAQAFEIGDRVLSVHGIVHLACTRGVACFGPPRGNEATFVRPDRWIPNWVDLEADVAEDELLQRYLRAFGPATVSDFALWTYMTAAAARAVWARLESELAPVDVGGRAAWVLRSDVSALRRAKLERPLVRLLPYFDSFLLGHKAKDHLVDAAHYKRVYREAGWLSPVVLVDGRVAGVWAYSRKGRRLVVQVEAFRAFAPAIRSVIADEVEDLRRFLDVPEVATSFTRIRGGPHRSTRSGGP